MKIQWLDSQAVARENHPPCVFRPDGQREHAAQSRKPILVPSQKSPQNHFRVAVGFEFFSARFQFRAQFSVVVDLAVEDQYGVPVLVDHWLFPSLEVNDLEAHGAYRSKRRFISALLVRPAMNERVRSRANARAVPRTIAVREPGYSAQMAASPSRRKALFRRLAVSSQLTWK